MTLYFLQNFSNYYNRKIKRFDTVVEYSDYQSGRGKLIEGPFSDVNFIPNDYVDAEHIINWQHEWQPDYMLELDAYNNIVRRWFVIESVRTRNKQFKLSLHRDVVSDYLDNILDAPCYIEKATLKDDDIFIYNREEFESNEIKKSQTLIKDKTGYPWIVGYFSPLTSAREITCPSTKYDNVLTNYDYIKQQEGLVKRFAGIDIWAYINDGADSISYAKYSGKATNLNLEVELDNSTSLYLRRTDTTSNVRNRYFDKNTIDSKLNEFKDNINKDTLYNEALLYLGNKVETYGSLAKPDPRFYNNKIVYDSEHNKYYRIMVNVNMAPKDGGTHTTNIGKHEVVYDTTTSSGNLFTYYQNTFSQTGGHSTGGLVINYTYYEQTLTLIEVNVESLKTTIPITTRKAVDAPYNIFALKYTPDNLRLAMAIEETLDTECYDVQVLPYCPMQDYIVGTDVSITDLELNKDYVLIKDENNINKGYIYFPNKASNSFNIDYTITVKNLKVDNQCDKYRLLSPNGNGAFEFSAAKNGGVEYIEVDYYLKPYNPYLHLVPNFKKLYGNDYDDYRGLICQGDFSIPRGKNEWRDYEMNNKNYENIFNRQIQNMTFNNKYQRLNDVATAITGTLSGAFGGGTTGYFMGGGPGAIVGAIGGSILSGAAGAFDVNINQKLRNESINYTTDLYNYNIQNIQALPNTIVKTGCLSPNNPLFPYIEYYTCEEAEKEAFINKIKWNGMTVMRIGTIRSFLQEEESYIKAKLIRLDTIDEDFHLINAIGSELNQGVFI